MNTFALLSLGILLGIIICALLAATLALYLTARRMQQANSANTAHLLKLVAKSNLLTDQLRRDVSSSLAAMDADRLHDASVAIQHAAKRIDHTTTSLNKVVFAAGMGDQLGLTNDDLNSMQDEPSFEGATQYDPSMTSAAAANQRPPAPPPSRPNYSAFEEWANRRRQSAAAESGASFPTRPPSLPDLDAGFEADLSDETVMSDADVMNVPGIGLPDAPLSD